MSVELKSLVERLVHDPAFRKAFLAKPEVILNDQPVAPAERRALLRARRRLLLVGPGTGASLIPVEWP